MGKQDASALMFRRVARIFLAVSILYVLLGCVLTYDALAQTRTPRRILTHQYFMPAVPTGDTDEVVQQYYDYLALRRLYMFQETYLLNPHDLGWMYGGIAFAIVFFYLLVVAWYGRSKTGDLYPVEVYDGFLSERGGPVTTFWWAVFITVGGYMVYSLVINWTFGQAY